MRRLKFCASVVLIWLLLFQYSYLILAQIVYKNPTKLYLSVSTSIKPINRANKNTNTMEFNRGRTLNPQPLMSLFWIQGGQVQAIGSSLSQSLGFNLGPTYMTMRE